MGHDHDHGAGLARAGERHRARLAMAFALTLGFFFVQAATGIIANSLALLSDAAHMLTDVIGLGMALAAIQLASRFAANASSRGVSSHTFGLFVNALLLFGVAIWVLYEAAQRVFDDPEVLGVPMLIVAVIGLVVNIVAFWLLRAGSKESLNVEGAYLEVLADMIGSIGVIIAAILLQVFGWTWVDPVIGAAIGLWILPRTYRLGRRAVRILLQAAPDDVDVEALVVDLAGIDGVLDVHDVHVWTLTSEMDAASAHLVVDADADSHHVLDRARELVSTRYGIDHGTFQVEPDTHHGCDEVTW
jgi:cobalt-zinc-cadmium efflux system protein